MPRLALQAAVPALISTVALALPAPVLAHGATPPPPTPWTLLTGWSLEVHVWLPIALSVVAYHWAVASVGRAHPRSRVPRRRVLAWDAGMAVLFVALQSPIATYDATLFSVHMVQHLLLMMVAAPLLALGAPVTLLLRVVRPRVRRSVVLPALHSRPVRLLSFPVIAWVLFAGVMYVSHFSPLFDAALESEPMHVLEHGLFLGTALLFWWPVIGADPGPWRLPHPVRIFYLFLGMPWSSFLGLAIFSAGSPLYPHYASLALGWGPPPLEDQQIAGGLMWAGGDAIFLVALILAVMVWLRAEDAEGKRMDTRLDQERARVERRASSEAGSARP